MSDPLKIAILCGGYGKRLLPFTEEIPKPMVSINGKPILEHILKLYNSKGFSDFILCIGYKGEKIREFISSRSDFGNIIFSDAGTDASMLQRIISLKDMFNERIMISYGDTLTDLDINDFLRFHSSSNGAATIVAASIQSPFGLVNYNLDGKAVYFEEKPFLNYYIGHIILEKRSLDFVDDSMISSQDGLGLVSFLKKLMAEGQLYVYHYKGPQITFNSHGERTNAEKMLSSFYTLNENTE
ncbi:MAG: nucleotidyltransferase family protein [Nitrospirae bacterium]|nr:nucleotidyltransferase family protein [Nitrospirota bacterium]MBF0540565.1 nucleotidyltransferase family protein [Nitrospirota bacterium]